MTYEELDQHLAAHPQEPLLWRGRDGAVFRVVLRGWDTFKGTRWARVTLPNGGYTLVAPSTLHPHPGVNP